MNPLDDYGPRAIIELSALKHNLQVVRQRAPQSQVMAVVKANAYGHGIVPTATALGAADAFGVARLSEALALRNAGLEQPIVLLEGVFSRDELDTVAAHRLEIVVHSFEQLSLLEAWRGERSIRTWLKVDTGMSRLGFRVEDFSDALRKLRACKAFGAAPRVMTHLACADETANSATDAQLKKFSALTKDCGLERSIANSAGLIAWPDARAEWVRPGLMLYGISPFGKQTGLELGLRPAMSLTTRLIALRSIETGESVGYGGTWLASSRTRVGIAAIGYGDGYPRQIGNGSPVCVRGKELKIAGRVSMDMIAIDLTGLENPRVGDPVLLWGNGLPVERLADCAGTIPYELVCGISQRVAVEYT